jgi:purine-binding chemotaxis protein CheW
MSAQPETNTAEAPVAVKERSEKIDFKMVTFSLAGKEYGIDIMSANEIAKASRFTYVPNAEPFVRGVYNLRGEIISVIDMRIFFHLPAERKEEGSLESLLILRVEDHVFGIIVDAIDKVVGISSASIQPPHPIFGEINVRYIKGVVENGGKLYIILDVEKIFAPAAKAEKDAVQEEIAAPASREVPVASPAAPAVSGSSGDLSSSFVKENLATFRHFHVSGLNEAWFNHRFAEWKKSRPESDLQLHDEGDADAFIEGFWSPYTGQLWDADYIDAFTASLPDIESRNINVWNPGCGKGHETWSLACILKRRYPEARIKIWANDSDLLAISMAPNMVFPENLPEYYADFMTKGRNGLSFIQTIRDSIFFEFHDALNPSPLPPLDFVLCRDTLSFIEPAAQKRLIDDFSEKMKPAGMLVLGANEAAGAGWTALGSGSLAAFRKES